MLGNFGGFVGPHNCEWASTQFGTDNAGLYVLGIVVQLDRGLTRNFLIAGGFGEGSKAPACAGMIANARVADADTRHTMPMGMYQ